MSDNPKDTKNNENEAITDDQVSYKMFVRTIDNLMTQGFSAPDSRAFRYVVDFIVSFISYRAVLFEIEPIDAGYEIVPRATRPAFQGGRVVVQTLPEINKFRRLAPGELESEDFRAILEEQGIKQLFFYGVESTPRAILAVGAPLHPHQNSDGINVSDIALKLTSHILFARFSQRTYKKASMTDPLTGLDNRQYLEHGYIFDNFKPPGYCCMLDIDHFKNINDTYGHTIGDVFLQKLSNILSESVEDGKGRAIRYGGEEFLLVFFDATAEDVKPRIKKIRERVKSNSQEWVTSVQTNVTLSAGGASFQGSGDFFSALKAADENLYKAKETRDAAVIT